MSGEPALDSISAIAISNDTIYIAENNGIFYSPIKDISFKKISSIGIKGFKDIDISNGKLYIAGDRGVWTLGDTSFIRFDTPDGSITNFVSCIYAGSRGETIFGSRDGVLILSKSGMRDILPKSIYFDGNTPNDIVMTDRHLWVATDNGLYLYHRLKKTSQKMGEKYRIPEIQIKKIYLDGDYLWLLTERGVYRFFWNEPHRPEY